MGRLYIAIAVIALVGGGGWAIIGKLTRNAATIAQYEIREKADKLVIGGLRRGKHESRARQGALNHSNNNAVREQRTASTSFKEGLKNETLTDVTRGASITRAYASLFAELRAITRSSSPDN